MIVGIQIGIVSGCAFYDKGRILFAASEERYSNIKNDTGIPEQALQDGMNYLGISSQDIEQVILVSRSVDPGHFITRRESSFSVKDYLREQYEYFYPKFFEPGAAAKGYLEIFQDKIDFGRYAELISRLRSRGPKLTPQEVWSHWRCNEISRCLGVPRNKIQIMNHELSHAAYGYYGSPFRDNDVLIVTFDGFGDDSNATISEIVDGHIQFIEKYKNFNVGRIYRYITLLLGMKPSEHEYKVMGLAPYATEYTYKEALSVFRNSYSFDSAGSISPDPDLRDHFFYFKERLEGCRFDGVAGALQRFTEEMTSKLVDHWMRRTGKSRLVLSGGVSLNIKSNMELGKLECVKDLFVVGSGGDESLSIGAIFSYLDSIGEGNEIEPGLSLYLGGDIDVSECDRLAGELSVRQNLSVNQDVGVSEVAKHLADGKILGRASGRMEFGARALGNRSILADPRHPSAIKKINTQIKRRDFWMPFTPSILDKDSTKYLDNPKSFQFPHMSVACETTKEGKVSLPAALHPADETARPQVLERSANPAYYELIDTFRQLTGVGALLNTSLNLHGFPIARTATTAIDVFLHSELDGIIIGPHLVMRKE